MSVDSIKVKYEADLTKLKGDLNQLENELRGVDKDSKKAMGTLEKESKKAGKAVDKVSKEVNGLDKAMGNAVKTIGALIAVDKILELGKAIINTTAKFQKLEAVLTNTLGSKSEAQKAMAQIKDFASKTPFQVDELTDSYVKLANQGFRPTVEQMRKLGDLASSTGKSFDMLTEAIIDAQTGEFERLKEFGIRASKEGDKVSFTFKGVKTQTDFTNESIRNYILSLGDLAGVSGAMAAISETIGGKLSNLSDSFDSLFNTIGGANSGIIADTIDGLAMLVSGLEFALTSAEDLQKQFQAKQDQSKTNQVFGFLEEDIKKLTLVSESEADARDLIYRNSIIDLERSTKEYAAQLETQKRLFGDLRSVEQEAILKELEDQIIFNDSIVKELTQRLEDVEKAKTAEAESDRKRKEKEKQDQEKADAEAKKRRDKELKEKTDALKKELNEGQNIAKQKFLNNEIDEKALDKRLSELEEEFRTKEIALLKKFNQDTSEIEKQGLDEKVKQKKDAAAEKLKIEQKRLDDEFELAQKEIGGIDEVEKEAKEAKDKKDKQRKDDINAMVDASIDATNMILDAAQAAQQRKTDDELLQNDVRVSAELDALEKKKAEGNQTEEQYQRKKETILAAGKKREGEIKTKDAQNDKKLALFRIALDTAVAIVKAAPNLPLMAIAGVLGAIQAGIVASTPIPKFAKGVTRFKGKGTNTSDSNLALLSNNESVVTAKASIENEDAIDAMNKGYFRKYIEKNHVLPALQKMQREKQKEEANFGSNVVNMMKLMKDNSFYDGNIVRAIKRKDSYAMSNVNELAKAISKTNSENRY